MSQWGTGKKSCFPTTASCWLPRATKARSDCGTCRRKKGSLQIPGHVVFALAFHPDGQALAAHCGDNVAIWQLPFDSDEPTWVIPGFNNIGFVGLAFSPDGRSIAASSKKNGVELWNVADRKRLHRLETATTANSIAFSPDGKTIAVGSQEQDSEHLGHDDR